MTFIKNIFMVVLVLSANIVNAKKLEVITTIKPLAFIVNEIGAGAISNKIFIKNNASPHDFVLRPSAMLQLQKADVVVWVGPQLESFIPAALRGRTNGVITLLDSPKIGFKNFSQHLSKNSANVIEEHEHHMHEHEHHSMGEHHHSHNGIDPHIWLSLSRSCEVATVIAQGFIKIDPENEKLYQSNLQQFIKKAKALNLKIKPKLQGLSKKGYFVFHDAYGYFEDEYRLNNLGYLTLDPSRKVGIKSLNNIKHILIENKAQCIFREPQFRPAIIKSIIENTNAKEGYLDPLASMIEEQPDAYFIFIEQLANNFATCLQE